MIELQWTLVIDTPTEKIWMAQTGLHRITWRSHFQGVSISPKYVACELNDSCWDIISRHQKFGPAQKACQLRARKKIKQEKLDIKNPPKKQRQRRTASRGSILGKKI